MDNRRLIIVGCLLLALVAVAAPIFASMSSTTVVLTTGELQAAAEDGRLKDARFDPITGGVTGSVYPETKGKEATTTVAYSSSLAGEESFKDVVDDARRSNDEFKWDTGPLSSSSVFGLILSLIPILLIGFLVYYMVKGGKGGAGGVMNFGRSKARRNDRSTPRVTFQDVAGCDEAIEELSEVKEFLANPGKFKALGAKIPTGVLLAGPPGTGKTLLARAVAGEAGVPFFTVAGSDFVEMFVGVGANRVRETFQMAKAAAPAIIFIDEIDAVGRQRGAGVGGGNDEREQTLNALLVEMDGFHGQNDVIVIAATNRPDVLDPALLRPGRFDRQVMVDRPDLEGRLSILNVHAKGKPFEDCVSMRDMARSTAGLSGADLANLINEAALLAARRNGKQIAQRDLHNAFERVIAGAERKGRVMNEKERRTVAFHEAGHAIVGHILEGTDPVHKVTIIPRGRALGYTLSLPEEDTFLDTRSELLADLAMFLGGRAAEHLSCGDITTGAGNDIERATAIARRMVTQFGMSDKLGPLSFGKPQTDVFLGRDLGNAPDYGNQVAAEIDAEVSRIMNESYERAIQVLTENKAILETMAEVLLERETVDGEALAALLGGTWDDFLASEVPVVVEEADDVCIAAVEPVAPMEPEPVVVTCT